MAAIAGRLGELWAPTGSSTSMTTEACTVVTGTTYDIDAAGKRQWDPTATFIVYDGGVPVAASGYTLQYAAGRIVFAAAPGGAVTVSGKYWTMAQLGFVTDWNLEITPLVLETTALGDTTRQFISGGLLEWSGGWESFRESAIGHAAYAQDNATNQLLVVKLYEDEPSDRVYLGTITVTGWTGDVALTELVKQSVEFVGVNELTYLSDET